MNKKKFFVFYAAIVFISLLIFIDGAIALTNKIPTNFVWYAILAIFLESLTLRIRNEHIFSLGYGLSFCVLVIYQPEIAAIISGIGVYFSIIVVDGKFRHFLNLSPKKHIFNTSVIVVVVYLTGHFYHLLQRHFSVYGLSIAGIDIVNYFLTIVFFTVLQLLIFSLLFSIIENRRIVLSLKENLWIFVNLFSLAPVGFLMIITQLQLGFFYVLLFIAPLLVANFVFSKYLEAKQATVAIVEALARAIETRDKYTIGHSDRVSQYAASLARYMKLSETKVANIRVAGLLHDIGKTGISETILNKKGKLTFEEYEEIKKHPTLGYDIIKGNKLLRTYGPIVKHHHEHYDGGGYPDGLKRDEIPIEAAIIAVADAFDAMTTDRPYRVAYSEGKALAILEKMAGSQFNPEVVAAFIEMNRIESSEA